MIKSGVEKVGKAGHDFVSECRLFLEFIGGTFFALFHAVRHPRSVRWKDTVSCMVRCGVEGLAVTTLICFLMGVILGYQSAIQMSKYGADLLLPVLVGCSIVRELGPLIVAIVAAGRSGSAFAAEIGSMKVSEELNALETMGLDPIRFLCVPKIIAMLVTVPLLTVAGDFFGMAGGYFVGALDLGITFDNYMRVTKEWVAMKYLLEGLIKSYFFAFLIAMLGCWCGFRTGNDAVAVGRSTTKAVVAGILAIVIADAILAKVFAEIYEMGV